MRTACILRMVLAAAAFAWAALPAAAQQPSDARLQQTREALRQAREALQSAENQRVVLERDKAALAARVEALEKAQATELKALRAEAARGARESQAQKGRGDALDEALQAERRRAEALRTELDAAQARVRGGDLALREQKQLTERLAGLLAASTEALQQAEHRNAELARVAEEAIEAYRTKTAGEANLQREPVFGLARARVESRAEALRKQVDEALRVR